MSGLRIGSLCSGYAGLDRAVEYLLGGELAWVADIDPGAAKVLAHRFPGVKNLGDITAVDWSQVEPVDVLCGGFPCTDVSQAGQRAGLTHGTRSGVWHHMARAIADLQPSLVFIENVRGLLTARGDEPTPEHLRAEASRDALARLLMWLHNEREIAITKGDTGRARRCSARLARVMGCRKRAVARCQWHERRLVRAIGTVLGSLADIGFDAEWCRLSASDVGSCHGRDRIFILAWPAAAHAEREPVQRRGVAGVLAGEERPAAGARDQRERDGDAAADRGPAPAHPGRDARTEDDAHERAAAGSGRAAAADADDQHGAQCPSRGHQPGGRPAGGGEVSPDAGRDRLEGQQRDAVAGPGRPETATGRRGPAGGDSAAQDTHGAAGHQRRLPAPGQAESGRARADAGGPGGAPPADADSGGRGRRPPDPGRGEVGGDAAARSGEGRGGRPAPADAESDGRLQGRPEPAGVVGRPDAAVRGDEPAADADGGGRGPGKPGDAEGQPDAGRGAPADADGDGLARGEERDGWPELAQALDEQRRVDPLGRVLDWGIYEPAIRRWEAILGRPAPAPTVPGRGGVPRLNPALPEWMMGLPEGWITDVPGLSKNDMLRLAGNGVVIHQAVAAYSMLLPAWHEAVAA